MTAWSRARLTTGADEVMLVTSLGRAIRFKEEEVRAMGLAAAGVMGIKPGERDDRVIGHGRGPAQGRGVPDHRPGHGQAHARQRIPHPGPSWHVGVTGASLAGKQRLVGMLVGGADERLTAITSKSGGKAIKFDAAGRRGRPARGSTILKLKDGETIQRLVPMQPQFSLPEAEAPARAPPPFFKTGRSPAATKNANSKAEATPAKKPARRP